MSVFTRANQRVHTVLRSVAWQLGLYQLYKALVGRGLSPEVLCANVADEALFLLRPNIGLEAREDERFGRDLRPNVFFHEEDLWG